MTLRACIDPQNHLLSFEKFPNALLNYIDRIPWYDPPHFSIEVTNIQTEEKITTILLQEEIERIGICALSWAHAINDEERAKLLQNAHYYIPFLRKAIPLISEHLEPGSPYLGYFENRIAHTSRRIVRALHFKREYDSGLSEVPGIHLLKGNIFINLKKTSLDPNKAVDSTRGRKLKKALWLNPPDGNPVVVAKKVSVDPLDAKKRVDISQESTALFAYFKKEIGIISPIAGGSFFGREGNTFKYALYLPLFPENLCQIFSRCALSMDEKMSLAKQLLQGLAAIAKKGTHGDIKPANCLVKRTDSAIVIVIADFEGFQLHNKTGHVRSSMMYSAPEVIKNGYKELKAAGDVWSMGLTLFEIFSVHKPPYFSVQTKQELSVRLAALTPHWIEESFAQSDAPKFIVKLIDSMLHPDPKKRLTASAALDRFSAGSNPFHSCFIS